MFIIYHKKEIIMSKQRILNLIGISSVATFVPFISASCNNNKDSDNYKLEIHLDKDNKKVKLSVFKARVVGHSDGDTITVQALEDKAKIKIVKNTNYKLRLSGIDTPEKNVSGTDAVDPELYWAKKASQFAKDELKTNKIVYVYFDGKDTYNRVTADVFYNKTKDNIDSIDDAVSSYSVEITKAGLTLPYETAKESIGIKITNSHSLQYYTYYSLGLALKYAYENQKGFFEKPWYKFRKTPDDFEKIYMLKPIGAAWRSFWYKEADATTNPNNVFSYADATYNPENQEN